MGIWKTQVKGLEEFVFGKDNFPLFPENYENYSKWCTDEGDSLYEGPPEISVITESNTHGQRSYGWAGPDKIIISDNADTFEEINFYITVANLLAKEMNTKGVAPPGLPAPAR